MGWDIKKLWDRSGFFIILGLCAVTVGITALVTRTKPAETLPTVPPVQTTAPGRTVAQLTRSPQPTEEAAAVDAPGNAEQPA